MDVRQAAIRWLVGPLQPTIRLLKEARENRNTAIKAFKYRLFAEFDADRAMWLRTVRVFAELDCLFSLAKASSAIGEPACRPEFVEGDAAWVDFQELRHPTLCLSTHLKAFIPNDVKLGGDAGKIALLTGGSSEFMFRLVFYWISSPTRSRTKYGVSMSPNLSSLVPDANIFNADNSGKSTVSYLALSLWGASFPDNELLGHAHDCHWCCTCLATT